MRIKEEVKNLWKQCFNDHDEFVDMYFRLRYSNESTMVIQSGNMIIASLQMPYYPMTFGGIEIQTAYISGACTHPQFRNKGVMHQLIAESFGRMVQKNIPLSILIPAEPELFAYYARTGYAPAFFYSQTELDASDIILPRGNLYFAHTTVFDMRVFDYFARKARERRNYVQHTPDDFKAVMEDLQISEGYVTIAYKGPNESICGLLFSYPEKNHLIVTELLADNNAIADNLLRSAARYHNLLRIKKIDPPTGSSGEKPFGMARIINAKTMLTLYAKIRPEEKLNIRLTDEQLTFNSGYYYISNGTCTFSPKSRNGEHLEWTAQQLNAYIFDRIRLYMSLMLE